MRSLRIQNARLNYYKTARELCIRRMRMVVSDPERRFAVFTHPEECDESVGPISELCEMLRTVGELFRWRLRQIAGWERA